MEPIPLLPVPHISHLTAFTLHPSSRPSYHNTTRSILIYGRLSHRYSTGSYSVGNPDVLAMFYSHEGVFRE
jgi:hypothetical protein